jgi:hypothetical protein
MEKKENYEKPELIFGTTAIRCSLLAGSTGGTEQGQSEDNPGSASTTTPTTGKDPDDARVRRGLGF